MRETPNVWLGVSTVNDVPAVTYSPTPPGCSTIGAVGLSFRVRNGTGRFPHAMTAVTLAPHPPCPWGCGGWEIWWLQHVRCDRDRRCGVVMSVVGVAVK